MKLQYPSYMKKDELDRKNPFSKNKIYGDEVEGMRMVDLIHRRYENTQL